MSTQFVSSIPNISGEDISIAIIGPDDVQRSEATHALADCQGAKVQEYSTYPAEQYELPQILEEHHDVVMVELESNPSRALDLVEQICANGHSTVMVYSSQADPELLMQCMRAGAREFLIVPFEPGAVEDALVRASVRRPKFTTQTVRSGKLLVFMGAKGGVGVTSVASNFAVALAQEPDQTTILIDLDLPLGDAALNLGITSEFSTINALQESERLDTAFLAKLLTKHSSGLRVLAAPGRFPNYEPSPDSIDRLVAVARKEFDNVVVDLGSRLDPVGTALYRDAAAIYLVTQAGIPELRNANRLINQVFDNGGPKLEIVLNRFQSRTEFTETHVTEALTRPVQWKIPNDHALVRKMQNDAKPLVLTDNAIARTIRQMAQSATGKPAIVEEKTKKKSAFGRRGFSLFS